MPWLTSIKLDIDRRGGGIPENQRGIVNRLRKQAFAVQRQFELAEHSARILEEMLGNDEDSVAVAVDDTYEAHTFARLRMQLFRLLIVDLYACVLDGDSRTGSVRSILKELRREPAALDALRAYYSDVTCLDATVEGENLDPEFVEKEKAAAIKRSSEETIQSINKQWDRIDRDSTVLGNDGAKRMCWARVKATAHLERTPTGIVALDDDPPFGTGKLTWDEPVLFLEAVRPYVYDVFNLLTATSWANGVDKFYVRAFWDRFKNGHTDLKPEATLP